MNREDVEALLAACERDRIGPHPSNETLAALCRRWLAVEDAPCAVAGQSPGRFYYVGGSAPVEHGQRVRLVPEAGQGESRE